MLYVHCRHATLQQLAKHGRAGCRSLRGSIFVIFSSWALFLFLFWEVSTCPVACGGRWNVPHTTCQFSRSRPYGVFLSGGYICVAPRQFLMPEDFCAKWFLITWPRTFPFCNSMAPCSYPSGKLGMFQALFRICYHCAAPPWPFVCPFYT